MVTLTLSSLIRFLPNFIYGLLPSNSHSSLNTFCLMNDNQDGRQNGRHLLVCTCGHYLSHLLPDCFQISYMDYFYQTLTLVRIWALSDNQDGHQNGCHLSVCTRGHSNLVIYHRISSNFIYGLLSSNYCSCLNMGFVRRLSPKLISPFC